MNNYKISITKILLILFLTVNIWIITDNAYLDKAWAANLGDVKYRRSEESTWTEEASNQDLSIPVGYKPLGYCSSGYIGYYLIINPSTGDIKIKKDESTSWGIGYEVDVPIPVGYEPLGVSDSGSFWIISFNQEPTINLTTSNNQKLSEVSGHNQLTLTGTVKDADVGDSLNVKYSIDGVSGHQNKTVATLTANGNNQSFSHNIAINSTIPQGTHNLRVWVEDDKGGSSSQVTRSFIVDKTKPNQPNISADTNWTNESNVSVSITSGTDSGSSGINRTEYRLTGATSKGWTTYSGAFNITNAGQTTISARTVDNAGNVSSVRTAVVKIDRTTPGQPTIAADTNWTNAASVPVTVSHGSDTGGSGVNRTEYRLTGATTKGWTTYTGGFNISNAGQTTIEARTIDNAGNISSIRSATVKIDRTAPGQPTITADTNWTNAASVPVTISHGSDTGGSGINRTEYRLTGATTQGWTTYAGGFNISNVGRRQ